MSKRFVFIALASLVVVFSLLGCMTTSDNGSVGEPSVSVRLLDRARITEAYGIKESMNPYTTPLSMAFKPLFEMYIIAIDITTPSSFEIQVADGYAVNPDGKTVATIDDIESLKEMWTFYGKPEFLPMLFDRIDRSYVSSFRFTARKGSYTKILVVRGKYPIEKPVTVGVDMFYSGDLHHFEWVMEE